MDEIRSESDNNKQLYRSLLKDYENALYQLAEARLHIDRLRFGGAHVNIHKHFVLTHSIAPSSQRCVSNDGSMDENDGSFTLENYRENITADQFALRRAAAVKQIAELQHRLHALHERTAYSEISLDEVQSELMDIHQMHQKLATDLAVMMDAADDDTSADPDSIKIKHELMVLAQQLQDFITLLQEKEEAILKTTMRRRSSSKAMNSNHQQNCNDKKGGDSVEDIRYNEQVEPGWTIQKEKPQPQISINDHTILGPQEGLLTPPYIPLNTDTIAKRGHANANKSKKSTGHHGPPRMSKIPIYSGAACRSLHTEGLGDTCTDDPAGSSTSAGSCSNVQQSTLYNYSDDDSTQKVHKKGISPQPLEATDSPNQQELKLCPRKRSSKLPCARGNISDSSKPHPLEQQLRDISLSEPRDDRNKDMDSIDHATTDHIETNERPPIIIIKHDSPPTLAPPSLISQTASHIPSPYSSTHHKWRNDEKRGEDKSVTAVPKMTDKGIQVDASFNSPSRVKSRRKKKHHKRSKPRYVESLLSSDESFVTLIEPKDFFKTPITNNLHKRKNRNSSYKYSKDSYGRGDNHHYPNPPIRRKSSTSRKKKPNAVYYKVAEDYNKPVYTYDSSLDSMNDTLSSSDSQSAMPFSSHFKSRDDHKFSHPKSSLWRPLCNNNNNSNSIPSQYKSSDDRNPHSDTSIPSRHVPILRRSRPIPIPCGHRQKEQRKGSINLDEAIDLAEKLKNSSQRMNATLLNETYLPRYSV